MIQKKCTVLQIRRTLSGKVGNKETMVLFTLARQEKEHDNRKPYRASINLFKGFRLVSAVSSAVLQV